MLEEGQNMLEGTRRSRMELAGRSPGGSSKRGYMDELKKTRRELLWEKRVRTVGDSLYAT